MKWIVGMDWLRERLGSPDLVIVDCRFVLGDPKAGRNGYDKGRIPGAAYLDLERDLSGPKSLHGGRHPLPDMDELSKKLGSLGIDTTTKVVAYDDQGGAMASRCWWLLQYLGHQETYIMDGGFALWEKKGYPVTDVISKLHARSFVPNIQEHMVVHIEEVKGKLSDPGTVLIDSREEPRYKGLLEPIDPVAGHIPGAFNHFWKDSLQQGGSWKTAAGQQERFRSLDPSKEFIVYCGSGVTACPNIIALKEAGYSNVKLYAGSWSDWISYSDSPVATGEK